MAKNKDSARLENSVTPVSKSEDPSNDYETQGHLRTLMDAHDILNNPDKMGKVHKLAGRHSKALAGIKAVPTLDMDVPKMKSVDQLQKFRQDKYGGVGGKPKAPSSGVSLASLKGSDQDGE